MKRFIILSFFILTGFSVFSQNGKQSYKVVVIGFYNLENLFDTLDNPLINDEEFLPTGPKNYNSAIYWDKISKLSKVISEIGTEVSPDGAALLGVAEVENDTVLKDLVGHELLKKRNYKIVHFDSPDARGVDVGLLYNPKYFVLLQSRNLFVSLPGGAKDAFFTRDILWVKGKLDGEDIHVYVNHWPSRLGGEARSAPARKAAAQVCKNHIDSIFKSEPNAKVIIMGDLNDDPVSPSVAQVLNAKGRKTDVRKNGLYNPWFDFYKKGYGTLAFQDGWNLFDQIIISHAWLNADQEDGFFYYQAQIFKREFMMENIGRYKGYPMRTWDGNIYRGGYSDHFPTYLIFLKKANEPKAF